jgi:hypothetical protein
MLLHRCATCGREIPGPVALDPIRPVCPLCGGGLAPAAPVQSRHLPAGVGALVMAMLTAPLALGAAKAGWEHGGPVAGVAAFLAAAIVAFLALTSRRG